MDKLEQLFEKQEILQKRLNNLPFKNENEKIQFIKDMLIASIDELMEAIRETPWKPWKKQQNFNEENFKKEIVDLWHFVINLSLAAGFNANSLFSAFTEKNNENHERQNRGY